MLAVTAIYVKHDARGAERDKRRAAPKGGEGDGKEHPWPKHRSVQPTTTKQNKAVRSEQSQLKVDLICWAVEKRANFELRLR